MVRAIGTSAGFVDVVTAPVVLTVAAGDLAFDSADKVGYTGDLRLGGFLAPTIPNNAVDDNSVTVTWGAWRVEGYETGGTTPKADVCAVDSDGLLEAGSAATMGDVCKVFAMAVAPNYNESEEFEVGSVSVVARAMLGTITPPVYPAHLMLRTDPVAVGTAPSLNPSIGEPITWTYRVEGKRSGVVMGDICTVNTGTGSLVTGTAAQVGDTCEVYVQAEAFGYEPKEVAAPVVLTLKDEFVSMVWGGFPTQAAVGVDVDLSSDQPISIPPYGSVAISAIAGDCSYLEDILAFTDTTECVVRVTVSKEHYPSLEKIYRITPTMGSFGTIVWGDFPTSTNLVVGGSTVTPAPITDGAAEIHYAVTGSTAANCDLVNAATGEVRAKMVDVTGSEMCTLEITAGKEGYTTQTHQISINLEKGVQRGLAWSPGTLSFQPADASATLGTVTGADLATSITYAVTSAGDTNCAFGTSTSSVLTFNAAGVCTVQATVSRTGYNDWMSPEFDVEVTSSAPVGITWSGYSDSNIVSVGDNPTALNQTLAPTSAAKSFSVAAVPSSACTIDPNSGTLTAVSAGVCYVTLTATESGRADGMRVVAVTVHGALDFATVASRAYPETTVGLGAELSLGNIPYNDGNATLVDWRFSTSGTRYGMESESICTVGETSGLVSVSRDAQLGDTCTITATGSADGFESYREDIELTLRQPHPVQLSGNEYHYCVLFEGGRVKCWGRNNQGQLGIGSRGGAIGDANGEMGEKLPYLDFGAGVKVAQISAGSLHTCAVLKNGNAVCWGVGASGRLGYGNTDSISAPTGAIPLMGGLVRQISAGGSHTCAVLVDGTLRCWGGNANGRLGNGNTSNVYRPATINLGNGVTAVSVSTGLNHTCAVLSDGSLKCWGANGNGGLGDGNVGGNQLRPVKVALNEGDRAEQVDSGSLHSCATLVDNTVKCWGYNGWGQLGIGNKMNKSVPVAVDLGNSQRVVQMDTGQDHTCAVLNDHSLQCWGGNAKGEVGGGPTAHHTRPATVDLGTNVEAQYVALGKKHSCAILTDHTVKCWGEHLNGSLGAGTGAFSWGDEAGEMGDNLATVPLYGKYLGEITWGGFTESTLVVGSQATPNAPSLGEAGTTVRYSASTANCTLLSNTTGEVRANEVDLSSPQDCVLSVRVSKSGFEPQTHQISIPLEPKSLGTITWGEFPGGVDLVVGGSTVTPSPTAHTGAQVGYAVTSDTVTNCDLEDAATGEVRAKPVDATGSEVCTLEITVSRIGYATQFHTISITLVNGVQTGVAWNPGILGFQTSDSPVTLSAVTGADEGTITYAVINAGDTSCNFADSTSSVLTFSAAGTCTVRGSVSRTGYTTWQSPNFNVVVSSSAPVGVTWAGYSGSVVGVGSTLTAPTPTPTPSDAVVSFSKTDVPVGSCTLAANGTVTGVALGTCYVTLSATHGAHGAYKKVVGIRVVPQLDFTNIGIPAYPDPTLGLQAGLEAVDIPATDDYGTSVSWSFSASGSRGGNAQSGVCSVDDTSGRVTAGASAQIRDVCTIAITGTTEGLNSYSNEIELTLRQPRPLQVTAGKYHNCVLFEGGRLKCWGSNDNGRLGYGGTSHKGDGNNEMGSNLLYVNLGSGRTAKQVAAGQDHTCAVLDNDTVKCWGYNHWGQVGVSHTSRQEKRSPFLVDLRQGRTAKHIVGGEKHTCAILDNDTLRCWGYNTSGQLGYGNTNRQLRPPTATVNLGATAVLVDAGLVYTCAILEGGSLKCWGAGGEGQLGYGNTTGYNGPRDVAVDLGEDRSAKQIATGHKSTCAILDNDTLKCWGDNDDGQLGVGNRDDQTEPTAVGLGLKAKKVVVGWSHACAILSDDSVKCWGDALRGKLGYGNGNDLTAPVSARVNMGSDKTALDIAVGFEHTCAVLNDYTVKCWGRNSFGALGSGTAAGTAWGDGANEMGDRLPIVALNALDLGVITWGDFSATSLVVGGARARPTAPTGVPDGSTVRYTNTTTANCELHDNTTGEVSAKGVDTSSNPTCDLTVTVSKTGYASQTHSISIPLQIGTLGSIAWGEFPSDTNLVVGGATVTPEATTLAGATLTYAVVSSTAANCELVSEGTGEVLAKEVDLTSTRQCTLEITLNKPGYTIETHQISIDLEKGTQWGLAWSPGSLGALTSDGTATLDTVVWADSGTVTYSVVSDGDSGCAFGTSSSSVLTYNGDGTCQVRATVTRTGYHDWTSPTYDIAISATTLVGITWAGYPGGNVMVVGESAAPEARTYVPSGSVSEAYGASSVPSGACTVDANNGTLSASAAGICYVTLTATESTRGAGKQVVAVRVFDQLDFTVAGAPVYSATALSLSGSLAISHTPSADDDSNPVSWVFSAVGSRGGSSQSGVCTVDNDPTSATFGTVTAIASAQADDVCTITIVGESTGGYGYRRNIELPLVDNGPVEVTGYEHSYCALFKDGRVKCWGAGGSGRLGTGNTNNLGDGNNEMGSNLPFLDFGRGRTVTQVSMGREHACAILDNRKMMCWGEAQSGRLGTGNATDRRSPFLVNLGNGVEAQQVAAGYGHTCAVMVGGVLKCWGYNNHGQLGDNSKTGEYSPSVVNLGNGVTASKVAVGNYHTCAITSAGLKCWGHDDQGQLGDGTKEPDRLVPYTVNLGSDKVATDISLGGWHTCAVVEDTTDSTQSLKCWGHNDEGQVGNGATTDTANLATVTLGNGVTVVKLSLSHKMSCVILGDDTLKCWGKNDKGQLGIGSTISQSSPPTNAIDLGTNTTAKDVAIGLEHMCAILSDDTMKCWGKNTNGALGAGTGTPTWGDAAGEMGDTLQTVPLL